MINVQYNYREFVKEFTLGITNAQSVRVAVETAIVGANFSRPRDDKFDGFVLENVDGVDVLGFGISVRDKERLIFYSPEYITPASSSAWRIQKLEQLGMRTVRTSVEDFFKNCFNLEIHRDNLSKAASDLCLELKDINQGDVTSKVDISHSVGLRDVSDSAFAVYRHPLVKALFLTWKYPNHESMVDSFMTLLLKELGYFSGLLFALQQFRLPLIFGENQYFKESIADFLIMDLVSYYKMAVVEDKSVNESRTNSLPQLVAESIALYQCNVTKEEEFGGTRKYLKVKHDQGIGSSSDLGRCAVEKEEHNEKGNGLDHVIGIRVNGTVFHFYSIEISEAVCDAMRTLKPTTKQTPIVEIGKPQGYDFWNQQDRDVIILLLDYLRDIIK